MYSPYQTTDYIWLSSTTKADHFWAQWRIKSGVISSRCLQSCPLAGDLRLDADEEWHWQTGPSGGPRHSALHGKTITQPPPDWPQVAWPGHLQPQSHAKYKTAVIVLHCVLLRGTKRQEGGKRAEVTEYMLSSWLILGQRIRQTSGGTGSDPVEPVRKQL